jgi:hypothetical protein
MKRFLFALVLVVGLAIPVEAKLSMIVGCTTDHITALLRLQLDDATPETVEKHIGVAFSRAAHKMSFARLQSNEGWIAFVSELSDLDKFAIQAVGAPQAGGACNPQQ